MTLELAPVRAAVAAVAEHPQAAAIAELAALTARGEHVGAPAAAAGAASAGAAAGKCPYAAMFGGDAAALTPAMRQQLMNGRPDAEIAASVVGDLPELKKATRFHDRDDATNRAVHGRMRGALTETFAPMSHDLHTNLQALIDGPVSELPMAGAEPVTGAYTGSVVKRWLKMRVDVAGNPFHLKTIKQRLVSTQQIPGFDHIGGLDVVVPIGDHGQAMANALVGAARVMDHVVLTTLKPAADAVTEKYPQTLADWTFQKDAVQSMMEGIGTYAGTTALLVQHEVPGLTGAQLLEHIEHDHLLETSAAGPLGMAGPMFFKGFVPKQTVALNERARLKIAKPLAAITRSTRKRRATWLITNPQLRQTELGCPLLPRTQVNVGDGVEQPAKQSYLSTLGSDYLALVRKLYAHELEQAAASGANGAVDAARAVAA